MAGYTRTTTTSDIATGLVINAADFNSEYTAIETAFNATGGHAHDGVAGGGARILKLGPSGDLTISAGAVTPLSGNAIDLGTSGAQFKDLFIDGVGYIDAMDGDVLFGSTVGTSKLQFRDTAIYINSSADGQLDLVADTEIQIAATTIDMNGNVNVSGSLTIGGAGISEAELEILDGASLSTTELNYLDGTTLGTVVASKVLAVDSNKDITGFRNISLTGTVDGIDIATRDAVLTSTTTTAGAALPKAGGALTGAVTTNSTFDGVDIATRDAILTSTTTTANAALPKTGGAMTGAITTNSTFDGRDVAADGVLATNALPKAGGILTGAITLPDGSESSPIITNTGDIDTGLYFSGGNAIALTSGGSRKMNISSSSIYFYEKVTILDSASSSGLTIESTDSGYSASALELELYRNSSTPANDDYIGRIALNGEDSNGNKQNYVRITSQTLNITSGSEKANLQFQLIDKANSASFYTPLKLEPSATTITGQLFINAPDTSATDTVTLTRSTNSLNNMIKFKTANITDWIVGERNDSTSDFRIYSGGTGGNVLTIARSTGNATFSGTVTENSDERLKDNITTISGALDLVSDMRGVTYDKDGRAGVGVIAQEIQKVLPELVSEPADGEYLSVAYGNISGVLIEAIKELRAEVDHLSKTACTCKCTCKTPEV
jgi:hypothetical protein